MATNNQDQQIETNNQGTTMGPDIPDDDDSSNFQNSGKDGDWKLELKSRHHVFGDNHRFDPTIQTLLDTVNSLLNVESMPEPDVTRLLRELADFIEEL
jgi:hypothetical protein